MKKEIYTPMERILIQSALILQGDKGQEEVLPTTKEVVEAALETKQKMMDTLSLDALLLEMEEKVGLMDGFPLEQEAAANEQQ